MLNDVGNSERNKVEFICSLFSSISHTTLSAENSGLIFDRELPIGETVLECARATVYRIIFQD
jgi:hypothetical protein